MLTTHWHSRHNLEYRLKTKFRRKLATFLKKSPKSAPFSVKSKTLAVNWWGKFWNAHLKYYTFNKVRLEKGKLNLRCDALADFKINANHIEAIVLGSEIKPYTVNIIIEPISENNWIKIQKLFDGHLELFEKILDNHLTKEMSEALTTKTTSLLPAKNEISFDCTCGDRISLCKHVATALYALGVKIDEDVKLLFHLRGINIHDFISTSIHAERENILNRAKNKSPRVLSDVSLLTIR